MLPKQRKGWIAGIAAVSMTAFLLTTAPAFAAGPARDDAGSWIVRLAGWLGLPPSLTPAWGLSSANIDPDGRPRSAGDQPGPSSAGTDDSANIDPNG
jgi:hypothetical protein